MDLANLWTIPQPTDPVAYSYRLYRNYDGRGSRYGDIWVKSASTDQGQLAVYSALRLCDQALTMVVINKTANPLTASVALSHFRHPSGHAKMYTYSGAYLKAILEQPELQVARRHDEAKSMTGTFPAMSASVVVIERGER